MKDKAETKFEKGNKNPNRKEETKKKKRKKKREEEGRVFFLLSFLPLDPFFLAFFLSRV